MPLGTHTMTIKAKKSSITSDQLIWLLNNSDVYTIAIPAWA